MSKSVYKECQSCSMPLKKDFEAYYEGKQFCSTCFKNGEFIDSSITVDEMVKLVEDKLLEMRFTRFLAKNFCKEG